MLEIGNPLITWIRNEFVQAAVLAAGGAALAAWRYEALWVKILAWAFWLGAAVLVVTSLWPGLRWFVARFPRWIAIHDKGVTFVSKEREPMLTLRPTVAIAFLAGFFILVWIGGSWSARFQGEKVISGRELAHQGVGYVQETIMEIVAQFRGMTSVQRNRAVDVYLGKPYAVSGVVSDVVSTGSAPESGAVYLETELRQPSVVVYLDGSIIESIAHLRPGSRLTTHGTIRSITEHVVVIDGTRIVEEAK